MARTRIVVDLATGEQTTVPYTAEEEAAADAQAAAWQAEQATIMPDLAPYQFRAMLILSGHQTALDDYISSLADPQKTIAQAKLDYSTSFERKNPLVLAAQQGLGLSDTDLDALWRQAAAIS